MVEAALHFEAVVALTSDLLHRQLVEVALAVAEVACHAVQLGACQYEDGHCSPLEAEKQRFCLQGAMVELDLLQLQVCSDASVQAHHLTRPLV